MMIHAAQETAASQRRLGGAGLGMAMRTNPIKARRSNKGYLMLEMALALILTTVAGVGAMREMARVEIMRNTDKQTDMLIAYKAALQSYVDENYIPLQSNAAVVRNGVTLQPGAAAGQAYNPTVADLQAMGYLGAGFQNQVWLIDGATFENVITPVGVCPGINCNVNGFAYFSQPILIRGTEATTQDMNGPIIGQMLSRLGGLSGTSYPGSTATITGLGGNALAANPVAGAPPGVVGIAFGYIAGSNANYVRMGETRNVPLAGDLTVGGSLNVGGATTLNNSLTVNGAATINNSLTATGKVAGDKVQPMGSFALGAACPATDEGSIAKLAAGTGLVVCQNGFYSLLQQQATSGGVCTTSGMFAQSSAGVSLFCQNGFWLRTSDRFGRLAIFDSYTVQDGSLVPKPFCQSNGLQKIYVMSAGQDSPLYSQTQASANIRAIDAGANYSILVDNSIGLNAPEGTHTEGYGIAVTGCMYD